jgi:hypothetical protein
MLHTLLHTHTTHTNTHSTKHTTHNTHHKDPFRQWIVQSGVASALLPLGMDVEGARPLGAEVCACWRHPLLSVTIWTSVPPPPRSLDLKMSGDGVSGKRPALTHTMGLQEFSVTSEDSPSPVTCPYVSSLCFVTEGGSKSESFSCMVLEFYTLF